MLNPKGHIICNLEKKTLNKTQNENTPQIASRLHAMQILCDKNNVHIYFLPEGYKLSKDFTMANGGVKNSGYICYNEIGLNFVYS